MQRCNQRERERGRGEEKSCFHQRHVTFQLSVQSAENSVGEKKGRVGRAGQSLVIRAHCDVIIEER